jgi:hypothetical protein
MTAATTATNTVPAAAHTGSATPVLLDWTPQKAATWGREPIFARHSVHQREMFSNDGLARLLDTYPRAALGIWTMRTGPNGERQFLNGRADRLPGRDLLQAVEHGKLWLNLRAANTHLPEYDALCTELFGALEAGTPGLKTFRRDLGVLISSPSARVHYHLDIPMVALWHIRGVKRFFVYPQGEPFARNDAMEGIVLRAQTEEVDYDPAFDTHAKVHDLQPGEMVTWPQNAPHRIDNVSGLNVSLSCEFQTFASVVRANALFTNGFLRRRFGMNPDIARDTGLRGLTKAGIARGLKLFNGRKAFEKHVVKSFEVDPGVDGFIRDIEVAAA